MTTIRFKLPKINQVTFELECMPEDDQVRGNASAIDDETDKENEDSIIEQLENGNEWAWCCVKVTASYKGQEGTDYLGHCSYSSQKDFIENSGYYEDMKNQAFADLIATLNNLRD